MSQATLDFGVGVRSLALTANNVHPPQTMQTIGGDAINGKDCFRPANLPQ